MANLYENVSLKNIKGNVLYIFSFWLFLIILGFYFANNTLYLDKVGGVSLSLFISAFCVFALKSFFIFIKKDGNNIIINKSLFFLLLLISYISLRIVIDKSDISYLRTFWFSTTLGSLLFYLLGNSISSVSTDIYLLCKKNKYLEKYNYYLGFFYILCNLLFNLYVFLKLLPRRRPVYFLIDSFGFYQRPGNFILINTFLIACSYFFIQSKNKRNYILDIIYFCYYIITCLLLQFIGSNNGFLGVFGIMFFSLIYKIYLRKKYKRDEKIFRKNNTPKSINNSIICFFKNLIFISMFIFIIIFGFFMIFRNYMPPIRILHYNLNEEYNPLEDRFKLFKDNFFPQLSVNPLIGNMEADSIISGKGTHVHSFVLSMMTHIGIFGVSLFLLYLLFALFEFYNSLYLIKEYKSFCFKLFVFLLTLFIFLMANIASFFSWNPLWFVLGFCFPIIFYKKRNTDYSNIQQDYEKLPMNIISSATKISQT